MRRWQTSVRPSSSPSQVLAAPPDPGHAAPRRRGRPRGIGRRRQPAARISTRPARARPARGTSPRRTVSTSGSSGIDVPGISSGSAGSPISKHRLPHRSASPRACTVASGSPAATRSPLLSVHDDADGVVDGLPCGAGRPPALAAARRCPGVTPLHHPGAAADGPRPRAAPAGSGAGVPPWAAIQRWYSLVCRPRLQRAFRRRSSPTSIRRPRRTARVRSTGPWPRSVSIASSTSSASPTGAQRFIHPVESIASVSMSCVAAQPHHQRRPARAPPGPAAGALPDLDVEQQPATRRRRPSST